VRLGVTAFSLGVLLLAVAPGLAQTSAPAPLPPAPPPLPGFVPPYEIARIVRLAGFDPLAPPLRQGTTYVVRAADFRGVMMRVVVDAHSGAIRAVNRIFPAPDPYGALGMLPPPYGMPPPYGLPGPPEYEGPEAVVPNEQSATLSVPPPAPLPPAPLPPTPRFFATHPPVFGPPSQPPLPRPRPAELASRKATDDGKAPLQPLKPAPAPTLAAPPAAPAAPRKPPPVQLPD
jgi:hypothetical protein